MAGNLDHASRRMDTLVGHVRRYQRRELIQKLERAGFSVSRAVYADSLGFPITLLFKVIGGRKGTISRAPVVLYDRLLFPISRMLDPLLQYAFGKNLWVLAHKQGEGPIGNPKREEG